MQKLAIVLAVLLSTLDGSLGLAFRRVGTSWPLHPGIILFEYGTLLRKTLINDLKGHSAGVWSVDFHPKSSTLCTASEDGTVKVWDARTSRAVRTLSGGHSQGVYCAKWSPDGAMIASGSADTKVKICPFELCLISFALYMYQDLCLGTQHWICDQHNIWPL